jgi:Fe2+ transport system protein B
VPWLYAILVGDYGLVTLGWYSFLWAFPVVVLLGLSVALTEEMGLKDRITAALDPCIRKDGLLILNQGEGALLASLSSAQIFVLLYLASTLTACVVTLWSVQQELGGRVALAMAGRQAGTAVVTTLLLVFLLSLG